tara:strand:- start:770 stop:952 length:183 start_codon:yes stop_codon:yes gene_type:complete
MVIMRNIQLITEIYEIMKLRSTLNQSMDVGEINNIVDIIEEQRPSLKKDNQYILEKFFQE